VARPLFFLFSSASPQHPPSFPTRRSSDLQALAYSFGSFATDDKLTQQVASLNANFDSSRFFNLQGGPIGSALQQAAEARIRQERSEEHTSELQSRRDLVCRLLLEKKKRKK